MKIPKLSIQFLLSLSTFTLFILLPFASYGQNSSQKILVAEGTVTISGGNKQGLTIPVDVSKYEKGTILYTITAESGYGVSNTKGKCWGLIDFYENGIFI